MELHSGKIEVGCLAMIIRSDAGNEGKIVTPLRYIGSMRGWLYDDYWEIDQNLNSILGLKENYARQAWMMRIGGFKDDETLLEAIDETAEA